MKLYLILIVCLLSVYQMFAQKQNGGFLKTFKVSVFYGGRNIKVDSLSNNENIDFMNYITTFDDYLIDELYMGFKGHFDFRNNFTTDVKLIMGDVTGIDLTVGYFPFENIGFNIGFNAYRNYFDNYSQYHIVKYGKNIYGDVLQNSRQIAINNNAYYAGISFLKKFNNVTSKLTLNGGVASFPEFSEVVIQKEKNSNYLSMYKYYTHKTFNSFFYPKLNIDIDVFEFKKSTFGIELNTCWYVSYKSINYKQEYYEWVEDKPVVTEVEPDKHFYSLLDLDGGIYLRW